MPPFDEKYVVLDAAGRVVMKSDHPIRSAAMKTTVTADPVRVGARLPATPKAAPQARVALVCNWNSPCGISTYSRFLADALRPKVGDLKVFSEHGTPLTPDDPTVVRCWRRGEPLRELAARLMAYAPDFLIVQHEFGIFPNACHFLSFLQAVADIPYAVTLHSVYEHQDKTVCTAAIRDTVVHSAEAQAIMRKHGHRGAVHVVPHGCFRHADAEELWNIFHTPYAIVQFGFGFQYKGVDRALEAVAHLKATDPKFKDIFYCYLCSENPHSAGLHDQYAKSLTDTAARLGIADNVAIVRGYQDEQVINNYLRTAKLAVFPYRVDPANTVYGASGAIRVAMANRVPIVASESHLFDDLADVLPRPATAAGLAREIDVIFSDGRYRQALLDRIDAHTKKFSWDYTAEKYLDVYRKACRQ